MLVWSVTSTLGHSDIQEQKAIVGELETRLAPLLERIQFFESKLPGQAQVEAAKKEEIKLRVISQRRNANMASTSLNFCLSCDVSKNL